MCNALYHRPGCRCGFGGEGHLGKTCGWSPPADILAERRVFSTDDFCRPTACPKCGAAVFFVRHNGGSVWFDALGQPWPKHGCFVVEATDIREARLREVLAANANGRFGIVEELQVVSIDPPRPGILGITDRSLIRVTVSRQLTYCNGRKRTVSVTVADGEPSPRRRVYRIAVRCHDGSVVSGLCRFHLGLEADGGVGTPVLVNQKADGLHINGTGDIVWSILVTQSPKDEG